MIFKYNLVLEEISMNPYMDTSVFRPGNASMVVRTICMYGKSSCHGDCLLYQVWQVSPFCLIARQSSIIPSIF